MVVRPGWGYVEQGNRRVDVALPCACCCLLRQQTFDTTYAPTGGRPAELASVHVKQGDCHSELCPPHRPPNLPTATARWGLN